MGTAKEKGNIRRLIDESRRRMEEIIDKLNTVEHEEILKASQQLDQLIIRFYREEKQDGEKI
ncbi:MAG: aspartyl-phosphate phosphatase Spo0E family protein [Thermotaleaceae bacterium]